MKPESSSLSSGEVSAFATCPKGLETPLLEELALLEARETRQTAAGVHFTGQLETLYRVCLRSRLANRVLIHLSAFAVTDDTDLYAGVNAIEWGEHFSPEHSFSVHFTGTTGNIRHPHYGALKTKDALVDWFREHHGKRPSVDVRKPEIRIHVHLRRRHATVSLDMGGESLHRRGYRTEGGLAPLKENLASALLIRADWPAIAARGGALIDPMCGSGTLLIEGAHMAMGIAPGLARREWGFASWAEHQPEIWMSLVNEAEQEREQAYASEPLDILGYDASPGVLKIAEANIDAAGLLGRVRVRRKELDRLTLPTHKRLQPGLLITNPPYGERLDEESNLAPLYASLGERLKSAFQGWRAAVMTGNPELGKSMGLRALKQYRFWNGAIEAKLLLFDVASSYFVKARDPSERKLTPETQMFANRLRKNLKHLQKWKRQHGIECFRLYDADIPEYAAAVDVYGDWVHVAEYRAPPSVDPETAERRLRELVNAIPSVIDASADKIIIKQRQRQRGSRQYEKLDTRNQQLEVSEGPAKLLVNLHDYLDTGLFLDHRPLRLALGELTRGKRFLNLFSYTAAASVHAALGGAASSTSVDLSAAYQEWAGRNFRLNAIDEQRHLRVRADCRRWLADGDDRFDVILLDPPTFSNSKSSSEALDLQRDHHTLLHTAMQRLDDNGLLIFTCNRRKFALDERLSQELSVEDMTAWSLDRDFQRTRSPHRCWFMRHRKPAIIEDGAACANLNG